MCKNTNTRAFSSLGCMPPKSYSDTNIYEWSPIPLWWSGNTYLLSYEKPAHSELFRIVKVQKKCSTKHFIMLMFAYLLWWRPFILRRSFWIILGSINLNASIYFVSSTAFQRFNPLMFPIQLATKINPYQVGNMVHMSAYSYLMHVSINIRTA